MFIALAIVGWVLTAFLTSVYFKAGKFKLTASIETLVGAGMTWVKQIPEFVVRLIALLELIGVAGIILAPAAYQFAGFEWALIWGVLAAAGLALTMVVAFVMHAIRGELKYTWKINVLVILASGALTGILALLPSLK